MIPTLIFLQSLLSYDLDKFRTLNQSRSTKIVCLFKLTIFVSLSEVRCLDV
jgi:hypothetical protein